VRPAPFAPGPDEFRHRLAVAPRGGVRRAARLCVAAVLVGLVGMLWSEPVAAAGCGETMCIDVVAVVGLIDEIEASNIIDTLRAADAAGDVEAVVLQLDSAGAAVADDRLAQVARAIQDTGVPVGVWVGPSGAVALGGAAELVAVADLSGIAPGAGIGDVGRQRLPVDEFGELFPGDPSVVRSEVLRGEDAVELGAVDEFAAIVREHIVGIDGVRTSVEVVDGNERVAPTALVRFSKLPLGTQFLHTVASPSVGYLLLVAGLGLLLFEFYTAGIGIAGVVGAGSVVFAGYGVAALPHNTWALVLVLAAFVAFAVDVQSGVPRAWTVIGMVMLAVGSLWLLTEFRPTWLALLAGVGGMAVTVFSGMPAMVRSRFGTPTIGRDWMVDEVGPVVTAVDPEGLVRVRGALWRARTNRATPIPEGDEAKVVGVDGLVLEVEPMEGAAKDYREMRKRQH